MADGTRGRKKRSEREIRETPSLGRRERRKEMVLERKGKVGKRELGIGEEVH